MLETRSGRPASQNEFELEAFIDLLRARQARSYLEVGARHGDTFFEIVQALPAGSKGVAVDLPGGMWGKSTSKIALQGAVCELKEAGYDVKAVFGDSGSAGVRQLIMVDGPYDAILIDGDHRYEGVLADWRNYGDMAPLIAFHDIVGTGQAEKVHGNLVEVPRLWQELKSQHDHVELVDTGSKMGVGVIFR